MKLLYLDWNLFSILKNPSLAIHKNLRSFLDDNKKILTLVYSNAHLEDIGNSSRNEDKIKEDIEYLSEQTKNLCICKYFGKKEITIETRNPFEFYNSIKHEKNDPLLKISHDLSKNLMGQYSYNRTELFGKMMGLDPKDVNNYDEEQLNNLVKKIGIANSISEYLLWGLKLRGGCSELGYFDEFTTAYSSLDFLSYHPDNLSDDKSNNLIYDSIHSCYGSKCHSFITNDYKCYKKSMIIYKYFKSNSKLLRTCRIKDENEFVESLNTLLD